MDEKSLYGVVATAVRLETDSNTDELYIVFKVVDDDFKNKIKKEWYKDTNLKIVDKTLVRFWSVNNLAFVNQPRMESKYAGIWSFLSKL